MYKKFDDLQKWEKQYVANVQSGLQGCDVLGPNDVISGVLEEVSFVDSMAELEAVDISDPKVEVVKVNSLEMYQFISQVHDELGETQEAKVETKYKTVAKKVRPAAVPLPEGSNDIMEKAHQQKPLRHPKRIGHSFTKETLDLLKIGNDGLLLEDEIKCFKEMLMKHGKAFSFEPHEIGCVDPSVVAPMVIFTIPHLPWNLKPIPVPKAHIGKLIDLLNERIRMGILEPSSAPYSN